MKKLLLIILFFASVAANIVYDAESGMSYSTRRIKENV
jgi:hypothetical protein